MTVDFHSVAAAEVVVFEIGSHRLAIASHCVRSLVRAVAATPLPGAPAGVDGVIDVRGDVVPVFDLRPRLALEAVPIRASEQFLICALPALGTLALRADRIIELCVIAESAMVPTVTSLDPLIQTLLRLPDGLIVLCDLEAILATPDIAQLARAMHELASA